MNWFKKIALQSYYGYGAWLSPFGELHFVEYEGHLAGAIDIIEEKNIPNPNFDDYYTLVYKNGYARLVFEASGGMSVSYLKEFTSTQKQVLVKLAREFFQENPRSTIYLTKNLDEKRFTSVRDLIFYLNNENLNKAASLNYTYGYGAWLDPNGKLHEVKEVNHAGKAKEIIKKYKLKQNGNIDQPDVCVYKTMFDNGYIRLIFEPRFFDIEYYSEPNLAQKRTLISLAKDHFSFNNYDSSVSIEGSIGYKEFKNMRDFVSFMNGALEKAALSQSYGYGAWLDPEGKLYFVSSHMHVQKALEIAKKKRFKVKQDPYHSLYEHNYIRLVFEPKAINIEFENNPNPRQQSVLRSLIQEVSRQPGYKVYLQNYRTGLHRAIEDKNQAISVIGS